MALAALDHAGEEGLGRPEVGHRVDRHQLLDPLVRRVEEPLARDDARVVDQQPDGPEALGALLGARVDLDAARDVAAKAVDLELALQSLGFEPRQRGLVEVPDDDPRAPQGEPECEEPAYTAGSSRDDRSLAFDGPHCGSVAAIFRAVKSTI